MSNKPLLSKKLPYVDEQNTPESVINYIAMVVNSSFNQSINDMLPIGSVLQSTGGLDEFRSSLGQGWSQLGTVVVSGKTVNIFEKIN
jgi:hypothetical protein